MCNISPGYIHVRVHYDADPGPQSALGWDYQAQLAKHGSQTDAAKGFGGKFGVQKDHKDKVSEHNNIIVHVCLWLK